MSNFIAMWDQVETNKKIGFLFANDADGAAWTDMNTGLPPAVTAAGYTYVLPDLYPVGLEDFTAYISEFKKEGCEICCGTIITPDFTNFWKQSVQQGYNPKVLTIGKALLFPQTLEAIGAHRLQRDGGGCLAPQLAVQGFHHRHDVRAIGAGLHGQDRRAVDRSHRSVCEVRVGRGHLQAC